MVTSIRRLFQISIGLDLLHSTFLSFQLNSLVRQQSDGIIECSDFVCNLIIVSRAVDASKKIMPIAATLTLLFYHGGKGN